MAKWAGNCPSCSAWGTVDEVAASNITGPNKSSTTKPPSPLVGLNEIASSFNKRLKSDVLEWDRVTGGGIVPGSLIVLTGDPGVGKSTLLLHIGHALSQKEQRVIYFSSEESLEQVKGRAQRLSLLNTSMQFSSESDLDRITSTIESAKPNFVIIDSIQSCFSENSSSQTPGSIGQLREATFTLMRLAKQGGASILITAHITKEGTMAGPKLLEHMVDAVFYLQNESNSSNTRMLRSVKNRFGTINEIGFFEMEHSGMREVRDINAHALEHAAHSPGALLTCSLEGTRPYILEMQALCLPSRLNNPQRVISGIEHKRVILIAAILEKYLKIKLSAHDIFFKVESGITLRESASDLGIALALLSSYLQESLPHKTLAVGEVSLTGHIRPASHLTLRLAEGKRFSMGKIISAQPKEIDPELKLVIVNNVYQLLELFPGK